MSVPKKDVDPATELVEEDDEQSLPEVETAVDLAAGAGPLAAGRAAILRHVKLAPSAPGVYRMVDAHGAVLYVGKAKNIRKRITSYARPTGYDPRIERMIAATAALEFVSTRTETEALLLEANLIKRLRPRFNVLLRDDKSFPYILITGDHWAPQILKHRGARNRDGRYYGPFASVWAVNRTITALQRAFLLRSCSDGFFESRTRPCLLAPDQALLGAVHARDRVRRLSGAGARGDRVPLRQEPRGEGGARRRDGEGVRGARLRARRGLPRPPRRALGGAGAAGHQSAQHGRSRRLRRASGGRLLLRRGVLLPHRPELGQPRLFSEGRPHVRSRRGAGRVPRAVLRRQAGAGADPDLARDRGSRAAGAGARPPRAVARSRSRYPKRGEKKELVDHALANAREALGRKLADTASQRKLLDALAECFGLARAPRRIEVYDNSHIQGSNAVGAMVVAGPEGFQKNQYRKFNIRSADLTPGDDFAMMREVLERRFKRLLTESPRVPADIAAMADAMERWVCRELRDLAPLAGRGWRIAKQMPGEGGSPSAAQFQDAPHPNPLPVKAGRGRSKRRRRRISKARRSLRRPDSPWPDLVIIDGGRGQLSAAQATLAALGLTDVPLLAVAKGPERDAGRETFFVPGREPFKLKPRDPVLYFVQRLRDEAHRFAIGSHRARTQEGHPRIRPAGNPRRRPRAQARAAAALRHAESDRARVTRRPGEGRRRQRRDGEEDLRLLPRAGGVRHYAASAGRTRRDISLPLSRSTTAMSYWLCRSSQNCARLPK